MGQCFTGDEELFYVTSDVENIIFLIGKSGKVGQLVLLVVCKEKIRKCLLFMY